MDCAAVSECLVEWMRTRVGEAGARGVVFGLSGGVDSAVVGALARRAFGDQLLAIIMPCQSALQDILDARAVAEALSLPAIMVELDDAYSLLVGQYEAFQRVEDPALARQVRGNIKPRLRMITLYYFAQARGYLVAGTGNRSELEVGYFTKHGDGGVDLLPIGGLVKWQVRELAAYLGVPRSIIDKPPTAGLYAGQTDEEEMGVTYRDLDAYLEGKAVGPEVAARIEAMRRASAHKRALPPIGEF